MAVVQVPAVLPRYVPLPIQGRPSCKYVFTTLETIIRTHLPDLFPGMIIDHATGFRVTRNSDFEIEDDDVEDLLKTIEEEIRKRRRGMAVRLQIESSATPEVENFLVKALALAEIGRMVDAVVRGRVHHRLEPRRHPLDRLGVDPELVDEIEPAADRDHRRVEAQQHQRHRNDVEGKEAIQRSVRDHVVAANPD